MNGNSEPLQYILAEWFVKQGDNLVTSEEIGKEIKKIRKRAGKQDRDVTYEDLTRWICVVRERLETSYGLTLWNVIKKGYKIATEKEFAYYTMISVKRTLMWAARTRRLVPNVAKKYIPEAFENVFIKSGHRVVSLAREASKYMIAFDKMRKTEKEKTDDNKS